MNPDGTGQQQITTSGFATSWQPIPINSYPRPKGATPLRVSLATAYNHAPRPIARTAHRSRSRLAQVPRRPRPT